MRSIHIKTFILVLLLLIAPVTLLFWGFVLPSVYDDTFMGELKYKVRLLEETPSPRVILLGGSTVAFGVDSVSLASELDGYNIVNFGMYAALGTTVMLDLSEKHIRPGDIVIVIPEQTAQTLSDSFDPAVMWQGLDGAFHILSDLPPQKLGKLLGAFPSFAAGKFSYVLSGTLPQAEGVYRRSSFDEAGDVAASGCTGNVMPGGFDASTPVFFEPSLIDSAFADRLNRYAARARERGAEVWYAFCPMNALAAKGDAAPDEFCDALLTILDVPVIGDINDSVMDPNWFYDTNFHLNSSGKIAYTRTLTGAIKAMLGDSSPTELQPPPMPDRADEPFFQGDDSDASCFICDGGKIIGLTAEGQDREALTVPTLWEGEPVISVASGAFSSSRLREVTLQANIRTVEDGAFSGCTSLERIVLLNTSPSACRVGRELLRLSEAKIVVPAGTLSAYRTDYFWSTYSSSITERTENP